MLNLNVIEGPYDKTKPRGFFLARKHKMIKELMSKKSGKNYNPYWNKERIITNRFSVDNNPNISELLKMLPWVLFITLLLINILETVG